MHGILAPIPSTKTIWQRTLGTGVPGVVGGAARNALGADLDARGRGVNQGVATVAGGAAVAALRRALVDGGLGTARQTAGESRWDEDH